MNKTKSKIPLITQIDWSIAIIFLTGILAVIYLTTNNYVKPSPFLSHFSGIIVLIFIVSSLFLEKARFLFHSIGVACIITFFSISAVWFFGESFFNYPFPIYVICYLGVILVYGLTGNNLTFFFIFFLIIFSEIFRAFLNGYFNIFSSQQEYNVLQSTKFFFFIISIFSFVLTGIIPYIITRKNKADIFNHYDKTSTKSVNIPNKESSQNKPVLNPPQSSGILISQSKTQLISFEQDTGIYGYSDVEDLLDSVVYFMSKNFKAYSSLGFIYDSTKKVFTLNSFYSKNYSIRKGIEIPIGKGIIGKIAIDKKSFMSGDLSLYPAELYYCNADSGINSILAVPILSDSKELLGALVIDSTEKNSFTEQHKDIMRRFSLLAAALITNVRMRIYQEKAAKSFQIFYEASQQFITALHINQVFDVLFNMILLLTQTTRMMIITFNEKTKSGVIVKISGNFMELKEGFEFPINAGLYSYAFTKRTIVNIGNFQSYAGKYYRFFPDEPNIPNLHSLIILPILDDEHRILGLLSLESDIPNQFSGETEKYLCTLIGNASVAITRAKLYQKMEMLATTDGLTLLYNHRTFQEQLAKEVERARRYKRPLSLLLMDIDHFKKFNDTYGHPVGDLVLKEIAICIKQSIRINDIPARYGGEEFAVIIPETSQEGAMIIAERIRRTVEQHTIISLDKRLNVTISVGCSVMPLHGSTPQTLIDSADKALYFSKENGRNRITLFSNEMK
jgi:diguanylate cyclase (GGDEF)-like protein